MRYQSIEFLTTKELADLLRIKERRVYDLASSGEVPCSRATGKLLFPRKAIDQWLVENGSGFSALRRKERSNVVVGSHDPLLEWALRESRSDLASLFDSSVDGLDRFKEGTALSTGMHIYSSQDNVWNEHIVAEEIEFRRAVLVEWAWRERGFIVEKSNPKSIHNFEDLRKKTIAGRQTGAGASLLLQSLADKEDFSLKSCKFTVEQRSELDCALQVAEGKADVAFGLKSYANQLNLDFIPIINERYDLLVCRKGWFDASFQTLIDFTRQDKFKEKATELSGYDVSEIWTVRYNGE